jgi:hypothetical protein
LPEEGPTELEKVRDDTLSGKASLEDLAAGSLRSLSISRGKATPAMQRIYLQKISDLAEELNSLMLDVSMRGTPADIFAMLRRANKNLPSRWSSNLGSDWQLFRDSPRLD